MLPGRKKAAPATSASSARDRRSDLTVAALGVTLGLICALFPWYIFFNPDKFGVRAMRFGDGPAERSGPVTLYPQPDRIGAPMDTADLPPTELDLFATGTAPEKKESEQHELPGPEEQPFPVEEIPFHLVHVTNGRAMIADDTGLWLVQKGSVLPDSSKVASIEQRNGRWVLVTSRDEVLTVGD